ncbi:carbamoyltransferase HypF [Marinobacterium jannaschii]|uniref:carbamoyltransferase HypF n=1 Tax=Marinobacterium jannaschii TaxID=64970 RepID=UPI00048A3403|nr:carbamoyltransferase HypF [Marinobacterium jannaschii]
MAVFRQAYQIRVRGLVQGVGFRPFVWQIARRLNVSGSVRNDASGVLIELRAFPAEVDQFVELLKAELPPLARLTSLDISTTDATISESGFSIIASQQGGVETGSVPDAATCSACLAELSTPADRRFGYPFINCTHCGPRFSITRGIPYDRSNTTMSEFAMCPACQQEYEDPADRRFHAQPNACAKCGPKVCLLDKNGKWLDVDDPFIVLQQRIAAGTIVAIKGLGGFHLVCDATNEEAVRTLRLRKCRPAKPFALMAADTDVVSRYVKLSDHARELLSSRVAPVVLLDRADIGGAGVADAVAPGIPRLGFMLPYTPLHHLLLTGVSYPLVMTSGNPAGAPQCIDNDEALQQLSSIADLFLMHDRVIYSRVDDSVVQLEEGRARYLRRARGAAPEPLLLPPGFKVDTPLLALGGELKSTICLVQQDQAILSQHLGDLEDARTYSAFEETIDLYCELYQHRPGLVAMDKHPEYLSTKYGLAMAAEQHIPLVQVQHHHAHIASCLGENAYPQDGEAVLGICLDGLGFGDDGAIWGGELLLADYRQSRRLGSLRPFELAGGTNAIREPWRCLYSQLRQSLTPEQLQSAPDTWPDLASKPCATLARMIDKQLNAPAASSCGRLFDAVAAALDCSFSSISYEGQAAIELEALAAGCLQAVDPYQLDLDDTDDVLLLDWRPLWPQIIQDLRVRRPRQEVAMAFHLGLVKALTAMVLVLRNRHHFEHVALSGGVMQNRLLHGALRQALDSEGLTVFSQNRLPANDGGLAFGQALVALARRQPPGAD